MTTTEVDRTALARVVATANGKGGVGKTSLAGTAGGLAAAAGNRVLLIDLDPQGNIGDDLGYNISGETDEGQHLVMSLLSGSSLAPVLTDARPNLDVICGGEQLADLAGALQSRVSRGQSTNLALAGALSQVAGNYDLVLIDTPPGEVLLQNLALTAARWVVVPTKADASSITGLVRVAQRLTDVREDNPALEVAGVVLFDVATAATRVRSRAQDNITQILGGAAPLFPTSVRSSQALAETARGRGRLVHELPRDTIAESLTSDYTAVVEALLHRIADGERHSMDQTEEQPA